MTLAGLTEQLADDLAQAISAWAGIIGPNLTLEVDARVETITPVLAAQLASDDDRLAAETVIDIMSALWPRGAPETVGRADWWQTPVGRACARSLGCNDAESVTYSVAAAMLGVTKGTVSQMMSRGALDRHPDGGVLRASVLRRLAR